jgi:hypothetical protein
MLRRSARSAQRHRPEARSRVHPVSSRIGDERNRSIDMVVISIQPSPGNLLCAVAAMLMLPVACSPVVSIPPHGTVQTSVEQPSPIVSPALPEGTDLTFAQEAGRVLIGFTVRPGLPGQNTLLLYVLPPDGPAAAADVPLTVSVDGQALFLDTCSRTCRTATLVLVGGEHMDVAAGGPAGGTAGFDLPALPAPDGMALLQAVQDTMHRLRTYRVDETMGPASPPLPVQLRGTGSHANGPQRRGEHRLGRCDALHARCRLGPLAHRDRGQRSGGAHIRVGCAGPRGQVRGCPPGGP